MPFPSDPLRCLGQESDDDAVQALPSLPSVPDPKPSQPERRRSVQISDFKDWAWHLPELYVWPFFRGFARSNQKFVLFFKS